MPRYRVKEKSFINNTIVEAGEEIEYDGEASDNLEPLDKKKAAEPDKKPEGKPEGK